MKIESTDISSIKVGSSEIIKVYNGTTVYWQKNVTTPPQSGDGFTLIAAARTSAGVYTTDGVLVRTLWSGEMYQAGSYTIRWDGTDDFFNTLPTADYTIKVLSNNVNYEWEGVVGNTSRELLSGRFKDLEPPHKILVVGNYLYKTCGYNEGGSSITKVALNDIQFDLNPFRSRLEFSENMASDGTIIYADGQDGFSQGWTFVKGLKYSDDSEYIFPNGQPHQVVNGHNYPSVVSVRNGIRDISITWNGGSSQSYTINDPVKWGFWKVIVTGSGISEPIEITNVTRVGSTVTVHYGSTPSPSDRQVILRYFQETPVTGLAVIDNYLLVSRGAINEIQVLDKVSGLLLNTITSLTNPCQMAVDNGNLWVVHESSSVTKYGFSNGNLTGTILSVSGLSFPVDIKVYNNTLAVMDAGTRQQIRYFNTSTGSEGTPFGQMGGYLSSPEVTNDRFGFWSLDENTSGRHFHGGITYENDGSFWVTDPSSKRLLRFHADRSHRDTILSLSKTYDTQVDSNNHSRLITGTLELEVGYNGSLNSSWQLKRNWGGTIQPNYGHRNPFRSFTTLSNGRTYGLSTRQTGQSGLEVVEMSLTQGVRYTGVILSASSSTKMYANGDVYTVVGGAINEPQNWVKWTLNGFDGSNNPIYSQAAIVYTSTPIQPREAFLNGFVITPWEVTSSNILVRFNGHNMADADEMNNSHHLDGIHLGTNKKMFKAAMSTHPTYEGEFPDNGDFDSGNYAGYRGNTALAIERSIIWGYNGEFWKARQSNKWNHFLDNGLFVGQFGVTGPEWDNEPSVYKGMAGNAFAPIVVKENGNYYLYHNDESYYGGIHRWKVTGLNTIQEQVIPISSSFLRTNDAPILPGIDLLAGIPYVSPLPASAGNVTRTPSTNNGIWTVRTNALSYSRRRSPDIYANFNPPNSPSVNTIDISLNNGSNLNIWSITGELTYTSSLPNMESHEDSSAYFDVVDNTGKVIVRVEQVTNWNHGFLRANGNTVMTKNMGIWQGYMRKLRPFSISKSGSTMTVTCDGISTSFSNLYDGGSNISVPSKIQLRFETDGGGYSKQMGVNQLRFIHS